jgi:hypothetical protein
MAKLGNGVKVNAKTGGMPDARMGKAAKIQGSKMTRAQARVHNIIGGVVHATSHNYGSGGGKGHALGVHGHHMEEEI